MQIIWHIFTWGNNVKILAPTSLKKQYQEYLKEVMNSVEFNKNKVPTWKDFEDSESVINYSDEILLLYRPDFYFSEQDIPIGHKKGTIEVISSKIIKGTLQYYYEPLTCRIKENIYNELL